MQIRRELGCIPCFREIKAASGSSNMICCSEILLEIGTFRYFCQYDGLAENEIDAVYLAGVNSMDIVLSPNPKEVKVLEWRKIERILSEIKEIPETFTAWFPIAFDLVINYITNNEHKIALL